MSQLSKILSTAAAGALDVWVGIITGLALGLSPALSGAVSVASGLAGVTLVVALGGGGAKWSTAAAVSPSAESA